MLFLLADDAIAARHELRQILKEVYADGQFLEAGSADELLPMVRDHTSDLLLLDLNLPGPGGLDSLAQVKRLAPELPVLVISMQPEEHYAVQCLGAGASGYMAKDTAPEELVTAVQRILSGGRYVSLRFAESLARRAGQPIVEPLHERLTNRELEVLRLIAAGISVPEISGRLHLSEKTVNAYRARILRKMQMKGASDLARYALEHNLID